MALSFRRGATALCANNVTLQKFSKPNVRSFSSNVQNNTLYDIENYPMTKKNTVLNVCPQGYKMTLEAFGKFQAIKEPGWFWAIPYYHKIRVIDDRELVIDVVKQYAHTSDNVSIGIAAQLYLQVTDVYKACYKVKSPLVAIISHTQSAMRTSVGKYDLDHLLKDRNSINRDIDQALFESEKNWGIKINRVEITELTPDMKIAQSMDLQATAERERRQTEKNAEAKKRAMELGAEGTKILLQREAEGYETKLIHEARGRAEALRIETEAQMVVVDEMVKRGVTINDAIQYQLTNKYIAGLNSIAQTGKHTTYFMGKDMSDANVMVKNLLHDLNSKTKT